MIYCFYYHSCVLLSLLSLVSSAVLVAKEKRWCVPLALRQCEELTVEEHPQTLYVLRGRG